ncbi:MAG: redox-sensing transcriptional repressor Rex [Oscillospiraceae bacterium]|nr:redox-sensing transcriptional repressor Rex [Oscillospiraceae bacterium]
MEQQKKIPVSVLKRLPAYEDYLRAQQARGIQFVSSTVVARALDLGDVSVRKDFALLAGDGRPNSGRSVDELLRRIGALLDSKHEKGAILVGVGKLGRALLDYRGFDRYGLQIEAAFDLHPEKKQELAISVPVLPLEQMEEFCRREHVLMGIVTVPASAAQGVAEHLIWSGIRAIWNFAPTHLALPPGVILYNENMAGSLAALAHLLSQQEAGECAASENCTNQNSFEKDVGNS